MCKDTFFCRHNLFLKEKIVHKVFFAYLRQHLDVCIIVRTTAVTVAFQLAADRRFVLADGFRFLREFLFVYCRKCVSLLLW